MTASTAVYVFVAALAVCAFVYFDRKALAARAVRAEKALAAKWEKVTEGVRKEFIEKINGVFADTEKELAEADDKVIAALELLRKKITAAIL